MKSLIALCYLTVKLRGSRSPQLCGRLSVSRGEKVGRVERRQNGVLPALSRPLAEPKRSFGAVPSLFCHSSPLSGPPSGRPRAPGCLRSWCRAATRASFGGRKLTARACVAAVTLRYVLLTCLLLKIMEPGRNAV